MASLTINPPPAKRLKTSATNNNNTSSTIKTISLVPFIDDFINTMYDKLSSNNGSNGELTPENKKNVLERIESIIHLKVIKQQNKRCINTVVKHDFSKLPGIDDICVKTIIPYLGNDGQALMNMFGNTTKRFLTVPTIRDVYNSNISNCYRNILNRLNNRYKTEFPQGTPLVCACEAGRFEDVKLFITCMKGINNMTLREHVNRFGEDSNGVSVEWTPLMAAAWGEHFQIVKYLIEQCEADPNIANSVGLNALHIAAEYNRTNTELIQLLLTHMSLDSINKKDDGGETPLDSCYDCHSPLRQEIIDLIRSKGGKANKYDANGNDVALGNGDLNVERHAVFTGSDIEVVREALTKIDDINEVINFETVLDLTYFYNNSPLRQEIIDLIRSKGGKANYFDANGRDVGPGNGDLYD